MSQPPHTSRTRNYLPHWEAQGAWYSVTFRLTDSLPQHVVESYLRERQGIIDTAAQMNRSLTVQEEARLAQAFSDRIESCLDNCVGQCHLRDPRIGRLVFDAIRFFHPERYTLRTWCIMPNHVHVLFCPKAPHCLTTILHSWKSFTANQANRMLARRGPFWMVEYFDHLIRDSADFAHAHQYILNNPTKAGLHNWPWVATLVPC